MSSSVVIPLRLEVELPKVTELKVQNLQEKEGEQIYQAVAGGALADCNVALILVLLHGL